MGLKELFFARLLGGVNQTDSPFMNQNATEAPTSLVTSAPNITLAPTLEPTFYTFPPVGSVQSYVLVTPVGVNQMQHLSPVEQAVVNFRPLASTAADNYLYVQADAATAAKLIGDLYPNSPVPALQRISSNGPECPVQIDDDCAVWVIGAVEDLDQVQSSIGISDATQYSGQHLFKLGQVVTSARGAPITSFSLDNPRFTGLDIVAYVPDGKIGSFSTQSNTDSISIINAFANVLRRIQIRNAKHNRIAYIGDPSNELVARFIHSLNQTMPVDLSLDEALTTVMRTFFAQQRPGLELDKFGCPKGDRLKVDNVALRPFSSSRDFPIFGMTNNKHDYGLTFRVKTNRWFKVEISVQRENCTDAKFDLRFGRTGLTITNQNCTGLLTNTELNEVNPETNTTAKSIVFAYSGLVDDEPYDVEIKPDHIGLGLSSDAMLINVRKRGKESFENVGIAVVDGQPRTATFRGFSPNNTLGVKSARTMVTDVASLYKVFNATEDEQPRRRVAHTPK